MKTWQDYAGIDKFEDLYYAIKGDCIEEMLKPIKAQNPSWVNISMAIIRKYSHVWDDLSDNRRECKRDGFRITMKEWIIKGSDLPEEMKRAAAYL